MTMIGTRQLISNLHDRLLVPDDTVDGKQRLYADLGAQEYIVFDPTGRFLGEPFRAWRRDAQDRWVGWEQDGQGFLSSSVLGLRLRAEGNLLRVYDPGSGLLPTAAELDDIARAQAAQLAATQQRAEEREQELLAEIERLRRGKSIEA